MARENKFASSGGAKQTLAGRPSYPKCGYTSDGCDAKPQPGHRSISPLCATKIHRLTNQTWRLNEFHEL